MVSGGAALTELLRRLGGLGYEFVTPTPLTHQRRLRRPGSGEAPTLRDIFGWSLPFASHHLDPELLALLDAGGALIADEAGLRSRYRVSRVGDFLFLHSAYPTEATDAVFLGPDTYRFVRFVKSALPGKAKRLVDVGAGAGAGGICAAAVLHDAAIVLLDCNPEALRLARVNAAAADVAVQVVEADSLDAVTGPLDLVIANPPFIMDDAHRIYRDGGGLLGAQLSLDWALAAAKRLEPGGRLLLYTGSAIVAGEDALLHRLREGLPALGCALRYEEIDPDIFGEELERPAYRGVDRIAAVGAIIDRLGPPD